MIISKLESTKYPILPLFLSVDKHFCYSQGYQFQFMPHMEEEATTMMHNLISVLILNYGDDVKTYFLPEALEAAKYDYWYNTLKRVMCKTEKIWQRQKNLTRSASILP